MRINNPNKLPTVDYRTVQPLQGELKELSEANENKLLNVLNERGFEIPLFIWRQRNPETPEGAEGAYTAYLLDGHQRQRVMTKHDLNDGGSYQVPYVEIEAKDKNEAKQKLLEITSQYGTITEEGFWAFANSIADLNIDNLNFDAITLLEDGEDEPVEEDEAPELDETVSISKQGEIYVLGSHRVMCDDSTDPEAVAKLMNGEIASLVFTDPPYGVSYSGVAGSTKWSVIENDDLRENGLVQFLVAAFQNAHNHSTDDAALYTWFSSKNHVEFREALNAAGYEFKEELIWNKGMSLSGADYQYAHEPCIYTQKKGQRAAWYGGRDKKTILRARRTELAKFKKEDLIQMVLNMAKESTVWDLDRDNVQTYQHPTQKPNTLGALAIRNSSKDREIVMDLFLGSGSTLMAAEQTDRRCYGMELDPQYCDVIRKRYWKWTTGSEDGWEEGTAPLREGGR